ncbi:SARP family transcriptional regulator [Streptomyces sp. NBC_00638]|uniref:AfsR/SARP family transcriptional regulator n=1 Tax=unclassified Streptomyces TaxID=2593676 RepID=UPI00224E833C|nr:BTAD domain-containing putative transcriptional regulator [Streptomyces sp. NBC_00638]MCX5001198.1 SARP family transcriptional regulator [Streptomyces sp. NBC_00638]
MRLFGAFQLECSASGAVSVPPSGQRILAYLGLQRTATRTVLAGTLWPDVTEENALGSLRTALWRLHRGRHPVVESRGGVLALSDGVQVDVRSSTRAALLVLNRPEALGDEVPPELLSCGELLLGWDEEWVLLERERLRQLRMHALESLSGVLAERGRHGLALEAALTCVSLAPLRESAHRAVAAVHLAENNVVEAYRHYEAFRRLISDELGVEPSERFRSMLPPRRYE